MRWRADPSTVLLVLWGLFIVYGTQLPFSYNGDLDRAMARLRLVPGSLGRPSSRSDAVSNVLLFLPWGGLFAFRQERRGERIPAAVLGATLGGMALSALVETCQLFAPGRTTSLVDLATNTAGAAPGACAGWYFGRRAWPSWSLRLSRMVRERPIGACALAVAGGLVFIGLSPFDVSIDLGDLRASARGARLVPFGPTLGGDPPRAEPWSWAREGLSAALTGAIFALTLAEAGKSRLAAVLAASAMGGGLALGIEVAQAVIPSRAVDTSSAVVALVCASAGAAVVTWSARRDPREWAGPALVVWALVAMMAAWTPPVLAVPGSRSLHAWQLVPFWSYYRRTDVYALADLLDQALRFVPLGVLLAIKVPRLSSRHAAVAGLGLGLGLEVGQLGLAGRTAEITDALSAGAGAFLGSWLWRRAVAIRASSTGHARYSIASFRSR